MTANQNSCAFTGHRHKSFPWKYDEAVCNVVYVNREYTSKGSKT